MSWAACLRNRVIQRDHRDASGLAGSDDDRELDHTFGARARTQLTDNESILDFEDVVAARSPGTSRVSIDDAGRRKRGA